VNNCVAYVIEYPGNR